MLRVDTSAPRTSLPQWFSDWIKLPKNERIEKFKGEYLILKYNRNVYGFESIELLPLVEKQLKRDGVDVLSITDACYAPQTTYIARQTRTTILKRFIGLFQHAR